MAKVLLVFLSISILLYQAQGFLYLNNTKFNSPVPPANTTPIKIESFAKNVTIPGVNSTVMSGYLNVNKGQTYSSLYYIFYGCPKANETNPLKNFPVIIWLNGGPGSSSLLGAFYENGPFYLNKTDKGINEVRRNITWNENYSMLFVDQPIGTGGSYVQSAEELTVNQSQIAQHFYNALQEFYGLSNFTSLQNTPLFIFGESYAGKYVPCIASKILEENAQKNQNKIQIPLKGISIGDGFTDPLTIMSEVGMFSYNLGLIDYNERITIEQNVIKGLLFAQQGEWQSVTDTFNNDVFNNLGNFTANVNVYNIQVYGNYDTAALDTFLQDNTTSQRYNLLVNYSQGSDAVYAALGQDFMRPYNYVVEDLLNKNTLPIIIYNGQDDLIVTNAGTMSWVEKLQWSGASEFTSMNFNLWTDAKNNVIGYHKRYGPLELRIVNKAGHLVPMDQPSSAIDMAYSFIERCLNSTSH